MRIAIVSTQPHWHGGEVQAALLAEGLRQRGHRCLIIARRDGEIATRLASQRFPVATFAGRGRSPVALWQVRRFLRGFRPDVLHYNDPHAMRAGGYASIGLQIPVRVAARRVDFRLKSVGSYRAFCDGLICVSRAVADVCRSAGFPDSKLHLVHDGVDPLRMQAGDRLRGRQSLSLAEDRKLVLCVAKLTDHKGHRFLLEALPTVVRQHPDLVVALAGDGKLRPELESQAGQLGLSNHVRFLGYRSDVHDLMAAADVLAVPSHMEGLCSSIIDAMLSGCPVVGTCAGGIPDLMGCPTSEAGDAEYGWMVPPRNPPALACVLSRVLDSPDVARDRAEAARRRAWDQFTNASMVDQTIDVYERLTPA
jgi:glycosyltransferase involved in cell wall biosynthesis